MAVRYNRDNQNPTTKTQRKEKNTMSSKNNNNTTKQNERKREQKAATVALSASADKFRELEKAVATSATSATELMLDQAQLVFKVSEEYKENRFDTVLINFRNKTDLESGSKYSQFKQLGRCASELRPVAGQLPSGWTSLYTLSSALRKKDKNGNPITIKTLLMIEGNGSPKLNRYSTQSEVRRIVHQAQGKEPAKKKDAAPPTLTVAFGINAQLLSQENYAEVERFLRDTLRKQFPFIADVVSVKENKVLRSTLDGKMKKAA